MSMATPVLTEERQRYYDYAALEELHMGALWNVYRNTLTHEPQRREVPWFRMRILRPAESFWQPWVAGSQLLPKGVHTKARRRTTSCVLHVAEGSGSRYPSGGQCRRRALAAG